MSSKLKRIYYKRATAILVAIAMVMTLVPFYQVSAKDTEDSGDIFPYGIFAASKDEDSIKINAKSGIIHGSFATNGTMDVDSGLNVCGEQIEAAERNMIYKLNTIQTTYFDGEDVDFHEDSFSMKDVNVNLSKPLLVDGNLDLEGNLSIKTQLKSLKNVVMKGESQNLSNTVICSATGDITVEGKNVDLTGLVYAPNGTVTITGSHVNLNSTIIIANKVVIEADEFNMTYSEPMASFVGTTSDTINGIYCCGTYDDETDSIKLKWTSDFECSAYMVWVSTDEMRYKMEAAVMDETQYSYVVNGLEKVSFKITSILDSGIIVESLPITFTKSDDGYETIYTDTDGDGLLDIYEIEFGTNLHEADTDKDGLSDYEELILTGTDPLKFDSVKETVSDAEADMDGDGLTNAEEIKNNTNPLVADSDKDGLNDKEELKKYHTNPIEKDTDKDGLTDGSEIKFGFDPNKEDTDENGILDGDETFAQKVGEKNIAKKLLKKGDLTIQDLEVIGKGDISSELKVTPYDGYLLGDERTYVGTPIEISGTGFAGGHITFHVSDSYKIKKYNIGGTKTDALRICYNDGEDTIPLETVYDEATRTISADITTEGIYFVFDVVAWMESMGLEIPEDDGVTAACLTVSSDVSAVGGAGEVTGDAAADGVTEGAAIGGSAIKGQVDIVFAIDTTGSMGSYIRNVKDNIIAFVNEITGAKIAPSFALVEYRDITCDGQHSTNTKKNDDSNWFTNAEDFKKQISNLTVNGGGDGPETAIDALEMARRLDLRKSSQKFVILVTDANYKVDNNYGVKSMDEMVSLLKEDDIKVSVVSHTGCAKVYEPLYNGTGGVFADVSRNFKDKLLEIASIINDETNDGYWIALNGLLPIAVKLKDKPATGSKIDTDGDGIPDVEELQSVNPVKYVQAGKLLFGSKYSGKEDTQIPVYNYYSSPVSTDSDGDGIMDYYTTYSYPEGATIYDKDNSPLIKGINGGITGEFSLVSNYVTDDSAFFQGHVFMVYKSYINDTIDFTELEHGWSRSDRTKGWSWDNIKDDDPTTDSYVIKIGECVTIGDGATSGGGILGSSGSSSGGNSSGSGSGSGTSSGSSSGEGSSSAGSSSASVANGVCYNMEVLKHFDPETKFSYQDNIYITEQMKGSTLKELISYCGDDDVNYWTLTHNCAKVGAEVWNKFCDSQVDAKKGSLVPTPKALKRSMRKIDGYQENLDLDDLFP